jgi:DNA adenine methylase
MSARPFIKYVGGKTQLLPTLLPLFPPKFKRYIEPFVGGGAVFFALAGENRFEEAVLNDWNAELVLLYAIVKLEPAALMRALDEIEAQYVKQPSETYYTIRALDLAAMSEVAQAARFIALNKMGFNGLYRVNKAGKFNVPWGKKEKVSTYDEANIRDCSAALHLATVFEGDFSHVMDRADEGDVIYLDPPYLPISATSDFTAYTARGFDVFAHERLANVAEAAAKRGALVIASNSDHAEVRCLYEARGFSVTEVLAKRNVNSQGDGRGKIKELVFVRDGRA